jgi:hypothetical protein
MLLGLLLAAWARLRMARLESAAMVGLEFEEEPEPTVHTLGIDAD